MPTRLTRVQISSPVSTLVPAGKRHRRTPGGGLPEPLRSTTRSVWQCSRSSWWTLVYARSGNRLHSVQSRRACPFLLVFPPYPSTSTSLRYDVWVSATLFLNPRDSTKVLEGRLENTAPSGAASPSTSTLAYGQQLRVLAGNRLVGGDPRTDHSVVFVDGFCGISPREGGSWQPQLPRCLSQVFFNLSLFPQSRRCVGS